MGWEAVTSRLGFRNPLYGLVFRIRPRISFSWSYLKGRSVLF